MLAKLIMNETATDPQTKPKKPVSPTMVLIVLMLISGLGGGIFGYFFGQKSLDGINLAPFNRTPPRINSK